MKILKHFVKVAKMQVVRITCKHQDSNVASCPFTGMTYITCNKCWKRLGVQKTNEPTNRG
jgi:hypothetical protein